MKLRICSSMLALSSTLLPLLACSAIEPEDSGDATVVRGGQSVVGGSEAKEGDWPWQAALRVNGRFTCGGSLIATGWVLTAKHCTTGRPTSSLSIVLGEQDRTKTSGHEQTILVERVVANPSLDIALIKLKTPAILNGWVQPVALAAGDDDAGREAAISGWGQVTGGVKPAANVLRVAGLPVVPNQACSDVYKPALVASQLCAGFRNGERGGCMGDSGGPLVVNRGGVWEQIGVVAAGSTTCSSYSIFTRVSSALNWVRQNVPAEPMNLRRPTTLHRVTLTCNGAATGGEELIDLSNGYANYRCANRFKEQCVDDGSFDLHYMEWCDYPAPRCRSVGNGTVDCDAGAPAPSGCSVSKVHRSTYKCDGSRIRYDEIINAAGYGNYTCSNRYLEQCVNDGSWDAYYDEWCEYSCN